jgi:hypothetical protein
MWRCCSTFTPGLNGFGRDVTKQYIASGFVDAVTPWLLEMISGNQGPIRNMRPMDSEQHGLSERQMD